MGLSVLVVERASDVGGTWDWNRYPGARCDVESMQDSYSFDDALQQDWHWPEKFSAQPDILNYARHVAERFDLRRDIQFDTTVEAATYDALERVWRISASDGDQFVATYLIMATGCISTAQIPDIEGLNSYQGQTYHTGNWPHDPVDFSGQHVGVIGTGSSGIQAIPILAEAAETLTVFQCTANYSLPARNLPMSDAYEREWKEKYRARRMEMRYASQGALKDLNDEPALEVSEQRRRDVYEQWWTTGGSSPLGAFNSPGTCSRFANGYGSTRSP
jgi:cyclohexanone monooxygenase